MPRPFHFQIPVDDTETSAKFYGEVFGWKFAPISDGLLRVTTGDASEPGIDGVLLRRREPRDPMTNSIRVASIDEYGERIVRAGGLVVVPKQVVAGSGYLAYFKDSEGNVLGLWQDDPMAR